MIILFLVPSLYSRSFSFPMIATIPWIYPAIKVTAPPPLLNSSSFIFSSGTSSLFFFSPSVNSSVLIFISAYMFFIFIF